MLKHKVDLTLTPQKNFDLKFLELTIDACLVSNCCNLKAV